MGRPETGSVVTLRSGHQVTVRPIRPEDDGLLAAAFDRLSAESRFRRFFTVRPALTERELAYLTRVDHHDHEALGAVTAGGEGVGVARYLRSRTAPHEAEAAITVVDDWQGRGLGGALLALLAERARAEGVREFTAEVLASNRPMLALVERLGPAEFTANPGGR